MEVQPLHLVNIHFTFYKFNSSLPEATKTPEPQNATSPSYKDLNPQQLKVAERLARQLHELEKKKLEGQKRQRDADEERYRIARDKVEEMVLRFFTTLSLTSLFRDKS